MSPQSRRGRAAQPGHRKSASHAAPQPARKPAPQVEAVEPIEDDEVEEARPLPNKREGKPVRRKRTLAKAKKSAFARYGGEWVKAYAPLFAVAIVAFAGLWAWVSFGPHTPTPKDNWKQIESVWKPKRDADLQKVTAAVAANDLQAELTAYKSLQDDTQAWMDALDKVPDWGSAAASPPPGETENGAQAMSTFTADGQTIASLLNSLVGATTQNDILANKDSLLADEQTFQDDFWIARAIFTGESQPTPSTIPTLALPPGTYVPTASPGASDSPGVSPTPAPTATPTPTPTSTPVPTPA